MDDNKSNEFPWDKPEPPDKEATDRAAKLLVDQLIKLNYHPVVLCGTSGAGKTTILASLCSYLKERSDVEVRFGTWPSDGASADNQRKLDTARKFYESVVEDFRDGLGPESSGAALPYMVPLEITPTRDELAQKSGGDGSVVPVRLAVLDMGGELFKPQSNELRFRMVPKDVQLVLSMYPRGVSMVYLAPATRIAGHRAGDSPIMEPHQTGDATLNVKENPDAALVNAIDSYRKIRPSMRHDRQIFALTKWDTMESVDSDAFDQPGRARVELFLEQEFGRSWAAFKAMRMSARAKWCVQYSAGVINDRSIVKFETNSRERESLDRYVMAMWNWLYRGATRSEQCPEGLLLFPEIVPRKPSRWLSLLFGGKP